MTDRVGPTESAPRLPVRSSHWLWIAPLLFVGLALRIGLGKPGLQYDEALFTRGTVAILSGGQKPAFYYEAGSWIPLGGRYWPLMVAPYIGALPNYLFIPAFAFSGARLPLARFTGVVFAAIGLAAFGHVLGARTSASVAAVTTLAAALHPGLILTSMFDNGGFVPWFFCLGVLALALERYVRERGPSSAFFLGASAGFAVWCRSNFLWLIVPLLAAILVAHGRSALPPRRLYLPMAVGGAVASVPLMVYECFSRFGTLKYARFVSRYSPFAEFAVRWGDFSGSLWLDRDRRAIWGGSETPAFLATAMAVVVLFACARLLTAPRVPASPEDRAGKVAAITILGYLLFAFLSSLHVIAHHFAAVLPAEIFVVVLALRQALPPGARRPAAIAGLAGLGLATWLQVGAAAGGLSRTRGVGAWSSAIGDLARVLRDKYAGRDVNALDWGFANGLYVLSDGAIQAGEPFWDDVLSPKPDGPPFPIDPDTVYVTHPGRSLMFPVTTRRFMQALRGMPERFECLSVLEHDGDPFAEVCALPNRVPAPLRITAVLPSTIVAGRDFNPQRGGDSAIAVRGSGFSHTAELMWDRRALVTTFGDSGFLTALVPRELYRLPGPVTIRVRNRPGQTAELRIEVVKPTPR